MTTAEELVASDGSRQLAWYLIRSLNRVSRIGAHVAFATAIISLPKVGDEQYVPVKLKVWSDDLPDDVEDRVVTKETIVRRVA